jgi:hypothetical protein
VQNSLPPKTISAQQVSDWIYYHKKQGDLKTPVVTGNNVGADWEDSCMYKV